MINVLIATSALGDGGITSMLKKYVTYIDKENFQIDFLVYDGTSRDNQTFFEENGSHIYSVSDPKKHYFKSRAQITQILKEGKYEILHSCNFYNSGYLMKFAKDAGIKGRLVHSHAAMAYLHHPIYRMYEKWMHRWISRYSNCKVACSKKAGDYLFQKDPYILLPNAVVSKEFEYDEKLREEIRRKYHIQEDIFLIGTVAMLSEIKNQIFLLDVLQQLPQKYQLMFVGDGDYADTIRKAIKERHLEERVVITGWQKQLQAYYSALDCFVLPSLSEGFPVSSLEAQASGLPTLVSDKVTDEIDATDLVEHLPIEKTDVDVWCQRIKQLNSTKRENKLSGTVFEMKENIKELEKIYTKIVLEDA